MNSDLHIDQLLQAYRGGELTPRTVIETLHEKADRYDEHNIWIHQLSRDEIEPYLQALETRSPEELPLYGIPFAIKDNIDLAGIPTTAGCAEYAYTPKKSAFVVQQLIDAGAIPVGKTNLDQFATGLVGTRSPYGATLNAYDSRYISGGSSSGSAVAVALGLASFALGTDTAGSGRIPAAFNNLVGIKPTRGLLSTSGVVPACRSLDCVSIFALDAQDGERVLQCSAIFDADDDYARQMTFATEINPVNPCIGVPKPEQLEFFGNRDYADLYKKTLDDLASRGHTLVEIDLQPFLDAATLLYQGPWVSERYAAIEKFIRQHKQALFPVTRQIISGGASPTAVEAFNSQYALQHLKRLADRHMDKVDAILLPTAPDIYTVKEVNENPVEFNSRLGTYTNFMNLLDYAALAIPAGFTRAGLPFGVTLFSKAFTDYGLLEIADRLRKPGQPPSLLPGYIEVAVCGAHLSGLPLNHQLTERGAYLLQSTTTTENYRLYALPGGPPYRPGLVKSDTGSAIEVEVWAMPNQHFGSFIQGIPSPLGIGSVDLADGRQVKGFICEPWAIEQAEEITSYGSWRSYADR